MIGVLELRSVRGTGGGPEKTILFGAEQHDRARFAITVCYVRDLRDDVFGIDARARALGVDYVEIRERHSLDPGIWPELVALARERRFDIIHGHDYKTNLIALLLARRIGAVPVATAHGWTGQSWRERWIYYPGDRFLMERMPRVIAVSSEVRDRLVASGTRPSAVTVLLNGIDPSAFRRDASEGARVRHELGIPADAVLIGAVGRLESQKRFDILLDAVGMLQQEHPRLHVAIVGDGSLRDGLQAHARRLGLGEHCRFLGHRLDIPALHDAFDLFVQSSEYEGTPNAVLEAMAMETPIVATDVGGTRELASDGVHARIVPPHDAPALAAAIAEVVGDQAAARRRVAAARVRIETDLSFARRTRTLEDIYEAVLAEREGRSAARRSVGVARA